MMLYLIVRLLSLWWYLTLGGRQFVADETLLSFDGYRMQDTVISESLDILNYGLPPVLKPHLLGSIC